MSSIAPQNWRTENGFDFAFFAPETEKPTSLVIYLHGIGDNAAGFERGAAIIQSKTPGAAVIALQAPIEIFDHEIPAGQRGFSWFPFGGPILPQVKQWISHIFNRLSIAGKVEKFAHAQLEKLGLAEKDLAYVGNSMGSIVALQAAITAKRAPAAVAVRGGTVPPFTKVRQKSVEVFLQMGEWDEIFNPGAPTREKKMLKRAFNSIADKFSLRHERSIERLESKNLKPASKLYPMQGHMLDEEAMKDSAEFIAAALKKRQAPPAP